MSEEDYGRGYEAGIESERDYQSEEKAEALSTLRADVQKLLDGWKRDHAFMFAKRRDEEDWEELKRAVDNL